MGDLPISTKVDKAMLDYLDAEAERLGVNRSEMLRRLLVLYRESRRENIDCPHCGDTVVLDVRK